MNINRFARFGAEPKFSAPIPVGQLYFPSWKRYESIFRDIFERQYYTNQGPLTQRLEEKLQNFLDVRNAICVTNATIGLMMTAEGLELSGKVIMPAFTFIASAQSLSWTGLKPAFCDVDIETHQIDHRMIDDLIDKDVSAIMAVNLWGGSCNQKYITDISENYGLKLYFDSAHSFGCAVNNTKIGNFGNAEVFSFHATKILSGAEGGCICTNDDDLADRLRNIRSSYGVGNKVDVIKTSNGRMSEAQAAIALMSLDDFSKNQKNNEKLYRLYEKKLNSIPGLHIVKPHGVSFSNYQYLVCMVEEKEFGLSRDLLLDILRAENIYARRYFYPGLHRTIPFIQELPQYINRLPNTDYICDSCIQFPIGSRVSEKIVEGICETVNNAHCLSSEIISQLR